MVGQEVVGQEVVGQQVVGQEVVGQEVVGQWLWAPGKSKLAKVCPIGRTGPRVEGGHLMAELAAAAAAA